MNNEVLILATITAWAVWGIFEKKALNLSSNKDVAVILYFLHICQIPFVIFLLNTLEPGWHLTQQTMIWSAMASCAYGVALIAYLTAMSKTNASLVLGSTACYPIVSIFLASFLLGERLLVSRLVGATITVLGIIGMSLFARKQSNRVESKRTQFLVIGCVILATLAWGIWGLIDKQAVTNASILEFYLGKCIWDILFLSGVVAIFKKQGHEFSLGNARTWYFCGLSTLCLAVGAWAYLTALSRLSASYVISICACYPIGMYILAVIFLKEKFDSRQFASLAVAVAGAILVQLGRFG